MLTALCLAVAGYDPDPTGEFARAQQSRELWKGLACLIACACFAALFLYWIVRAAVRPATPPAGAAEPPAFPVMTNQRGWYVVRGVDRQTRMDTSERIHADDAANAQAKAELNGVVVTSVQFERP